jgi:hypothetical protein
MNDILIMFYLDKVNFEAIYVKNNSVILNNLKINNG